MEIHKIKIAGFSVGDSLYITKGVNYECGDITDGICLKLDKNKAGFVVSLSSLLRGLKWAGYKPHETKLKQPRKEEECE